MTQLKVDGEGIDIDMVLVNRGELFALQSELRITARRMVNSHEEVAGALTIIQKSLLLRAPHIEEINMLYYILAKDAKLGHLSPYLYVQWSEKALMYLDMYIHSVTKDKWIQDLNVEELSNIVITNVQTREYWHCKSVQDNMHKLSLISKERLMEYLEILSEASF